MTAGAAMFPFVMPSSTNPSHSLTIWDASSSHLTLTVMFWATMVFLPIVISYTLWNYRKMWGKLTVAEMQDRFAAY
jgi:cytochrome d ubiquinol oxidase subunit II